MPFGMQQGRQRTAWTRRTLAGLAALGLLLLCTARAGADGPAERTLVFFGDSLCAGYGLADPDIQSFPALVRRRIEAGHLPWKVINAGLNGETSAGGLRRIDWVLRQHVDVLVLELGGNDGLRGTQTDVTRANLQAIIERVRSAYPAARIVLAGIRMPASMGQDYAEAFRRIYPDLAAKNGLILIPFLLEGVATVPELNQGDGIHPNARGAEIVADTVWKALTPLLN